MQFKEDDEEQLSLFNYFKSTEKITRKKHGAFESKATSAMTTICDEADLKPRLKIKEDVNITFMSSQS